MRNKAGYAYYPCHEDLPAEQAQQSPRRRPRSSYGKSDNAHCKYGAPMLFIEHPRMKEGELDHTPQSSSASTVKSCHVSGMRKGNHPKSQSRMTRYCSTTQWIAVAHLTLSSKTEASPIMASTVFVRCQNQANSDTDAFARVVTCDWWDMTTSAA